MCCKMCKGTCTVHVQSGNREFIALWLVRKKEQKKRKKETDLRAGHSKPV